MTSGGEDLATQSPNRQTPIAATTGRVAEILPTADLARITSPFAGQTVGARYLGPGWVNDLGIACVVIIAASDKTVARLRSAGRFALIAWRWNVSPAVPFSLTVIEPDSSPRPHTRWMRPSDDPVVAAIRREGRLMVCVANADGSHSGWYGASFDGMHQHLALTGKALESLWEMPTPGIRYSNVNERFDPTRRTPYEDEDVVQIPLWVEPVSEHWEMVNSSGPWSDDIRGRDKALGAWASQASLWRGRSAGWVQALKERQHLDGMPPYVDEKGAWARDDEFRARAIIMVGRAPSLGKWLAAMVGPTPDAKATYDAAFQTLHTPYDLFCCVDKMFELLRELGDWELTETIQATIEAVLLDHRVTHSGTQRPWLSNAAAGYGLEIKASPFDLDAPLEDVWRLWKSGVELSGLFDLGQRVGPNDFPAPLDVVCQALDDLQLEGTIDEAEAKVQSLLVEAQAGRQWSIPWGARVEVAFGPFTAVRIFESGGEFSCHFLDDQDRYLLVAIGLQQQPPRVSCTKIVKWRSDDDQALWNAEAEASLMLIAAAIVRDFIVVEERASLFNARPMRRRIRGRDVRCVIYLPRVRYSTPHPERLSLEPAGTARARHSVAPHVRKAMNPSAAQRFLAQRYGMQLPEGFTFVKPHERGGSAEIERVKVYRSRSASRMIFDEVAKAPAGSRPAWFDFEKDCASLLQRRGMTVIHQAANRDGDGGVDLFAEDRDGGTWVVQCKCWAAHRPVGPDVVRELQGAIALADRGKSSVSHGMLITTSHLTAAAKESADALGFKVIEGLDLQAAFGSQ